MATAAPITSYSDREFLFRLQTLVFDGGTEVLRNIFDQRLQNQPLNVFLARERSTINRLRRQNTLTRVQYDSLYPSSGQLPTSSSFDITLIVCLLRHLPSLGCNQNYNWNVSPQTGDTSVEADVCRLRAFRNEIAFVSSTTGFQPLSFEAKWREIETVLLRLDQNSPTPNFRQTIDSYKYGPMDPANEQKIKIMIGQWQERDRSIETDMQLMLKDLSYTKEAVERMKKDLSDMKEGVKSTKKDFTDSNEDVKSIKKDFSGTKEYVQSIKKDFSDTKDEVKSIEKDVSYLRQVITSQEEIEKAAENAYVKMKSNSAVPDELAYDPRTLELYETAIKEGKERDRNIRVMVVGCYGQGKTSLVRHLTGQSLEDIESTNGIEVQICEAILDAQELWAFKPPGDVRVESVKRLATVARLIANKPPEHISSHDSSGNSDTHVAQKAKTGNEKQNNLLENTQKKITGHDKLVQQSGEKNVDVHTVSGGVLTMDSLEFVKEIKETNEEENKLQEKTLNINIWDFGGQFVYYATHQLFHSRQAIYILVFDIAKGLGVNVYDEDCPNKEKEKSMEEYLKFWIRSVHSFVGNKTGTEPPIFLVGTHLDMLAEHIDEYGRFEDVRNLFDCTACAPHIQPEHFAVSNTNPNPATFADIRRAVTDYASKKSADLFIPAKWIPLERSLKENRHLKIITFEEVKEFDRLNDIPIASEDQLKIFLQYHHEKGTFFYFENEYNAINHVVLDPQFLIDAFRCIITADKFCCVDQNLRSLWQKLRNEAVLEEELLNKLWEKESNKEFMKFKKPLLFFLQRHRIIAEALAFDEASSTPVPLNFYIVPSFLKKADEGMIDDFLKGKRYTQLSIGYKFKYDSTLCTVYNRVTAAVFGRWPILKFKSTALVYENAVVCKIDLSHSGILKRFNKSLELLVVNLCPEEDVSMKDCDAFRRFVEMVIQEELHKFQTKDFEKQYRGYREIVRCYDKDHGYSGSCNVHKFEKLRACNKDIIGCPDNLSHSISKNDMAVWFNVDIADADVPKRTLTTKELSKLSTSIGKNWENLARMLGFSDVEIEQVSMDKASTQLRIYEILKRWSAEKLDGATLDVLIHAIRECRPNLTVNSDTLKNLIEGTLLNRQY